MSEREELAATVVGHLRRTLPDEALGEVRITSAKSRARSRRRPVFRFEFEGGLVVYAKIYPPGGEALRCFELLRGLHGRFPQSPVNRVVEVIGVMEARDVVLTRSAPGTDLHSITPGGAGWTDGIQRAARWLADLHATPDPIGEPRYAAELARLEGRVDRLVARERPLSFDPAELVDRVRSTGRPKTDRVVQIHGRYHSRHVFLSETSVTAIDLDRAGTGDAAADVASFINRLRADIVKAGLDPDLGDEGTHVFLDAYRRASRSELTSLAHHRAVSALLTLLHTARKEHIGADERKRRVDKYHREVLQALRDADAS